MSNPPPPIISTPPIIRDSRVLGRWLLVFMLLLLVETETWSKYNYIDNLSSTLVAEEKDGSK